MHPVSLCISVSFFSKVIFLLFSQVDERFRILNGHYFGKFNTLVFHCSPPFGNGYNGLSDDEVVEEALKTLRGMYGSESVPEAPLFSHVTRWDSDPFSMGAYSYWKVGMRLDDVLNSACPEPDMRKASDDCDHKYGINHNEADVDDRNMQVLNELRNPNLFFCGEHATIRDAQCVHGACNSGERAARQLTLAALGLLPDLYTCICGGENFWYEEHRVKCFPEEKPSSRQNDISPSPLRSHDSPVGPPDFTEGTSTKTTKAESDDGIYLSEAGKVFVFHPSFSPFPDVEESRWRQQRWTFSCVCGVSGENYDDGSSMLQCNLCGVWQHIKCVAPYSMPKVGCKNTSGERKGNEPSHSMTSNEATDGVISVQQTHLCHICDPSTFKSCPALWKKEKVQAKTKDSQQKQEAYSQLQVSQPRVTIWDEYEDCDDTTNNDDYDGNENEDENNDSENCDDNDADDNDAYNGYDIIDENTEGYESSSEVIRHCDPIGLHTGKRRRVQLLEDLVEHATIDGTRISENECPPTENRFSREMCSTNSNNFDEDEMSLLQVAYCAEWKRLIMLLRETSSLVVNTSQQIMVRERQLSLTNKNAEDCADPIDTPKSGLPFDFHI